MLYIHTDEIHNMIAPREIVPIIMNLVNPKSVLDVGCGTGTWLKAFEETGILDYLGVDGEFVEKSRLVIPLDKFAAKDLRTAWSVDQKFDLILSLEVAEHLPEASADLFVETLVNHGYVILFSAAIPGQGGQNHLNEQWPQYWQQKFLKHGYFFHDIIRPLVWDNEKVDWWYRQNIFLISKEESNEKIINCVHPACYNFHVRILTEMNSSLRSGKLGIVFSFKILLSAIKLFINRKMNF